MPKTTVEAEPAAAEPRLQSKTAAVLELLRRPEGATIEDITGMTGWQRHTIRAALTGLKNKGHAVEREKVNGVSRYRITKAAGQ
jgi:DNA-binding IclR family transcriptional regulator